MAALKAMGDWPIVDADSHVTESADAWTARMPRKFLDIAPRVEKHPRTGHSHWRVGDRWYWAVAGGTLSQAGWPEPLPSTPFEYEDADPAVFDAKLRLQRMDQYGIDAAILYPNLIGFASAAMIPLGLEYSVAAVRAYNDFIWDWSSADHDRLLPMASLPFWDIESAIAEMQRCADTGFRGVLLANKFERIGLPSFVDPHWDPLYAAAQDLDLPVNYHIGFGQWEDEFDEEIGAFGSKYREIDSQRQIDSAMFAGSAVMANNEQLGRILTSGLCERFPRLKLVNVETGLAHVVFYLESLDWHWKVHGNSRVLPELPSEYFRRQCFNTYWFERKTLPILEEYPDNFMFSTDFPHGTGLGPGAGNGTTLMPKEWVADAYERIDPVLRDKALYGNASKVYGIDIRPSREDVPLGVEVR